MTLPPEPLEPGEGEAAAPDEQLEPAALPPPAISEPEPEPFTSGEKIRSLLEVAFQGDAKDPRARAAVRAIHTARRFRLLGPVLEVFPPLEDADAWDEWLGLAVGVCLNLISDGRDVDVDAARAAGAQVLGQLYSGEAR